MSKLLDGKTAIVTGASQGLGLAISTALCTDGASVLMVARDEQKVAEAAAGLQDSGLQATAMVADVTVEGAADDVAVAGFDLYGQISSTTTY